MTTGSVRLRHQSRIVTSDAKRLALVGYRFQQTLAAEIEEHEVVFRLYVLIGNPHAVNKSRKRTTEIPNALEPWLTTRELTGPPIQSGVFEQQIKVTTLYRRVTYEDFPRARVQRCFSCGLYDRLVRK